MAYLLQQLGQGPRARPEDWPLAVAGQRVQIIKREPGRGSRLKLGTEGWQQQTAAWRPAGGITGRVNWRHHLVDLMRRCFPQQFRSGRCRQRCDAILGLKEV